MTKAQVVAVKDAAMDQFANPIVVPSVGVAIRSFADEVNRAEPQNQMHAHPEDFELWHLAEYDTETGTFTKQDECRRLVRGVEVKNKGA